MSKRTFQIDKESCSGKQRKRLFEHGSCELEPNSVEMLRMGNAGSEVGYKLSEGALPVAKVTYNPKQTRLDRVSSSGWEVRNGKYAAKHRTGCEVSGNKKDNVECVPLLNTMLVDNKGIPDNYQADLCRDKVREVLDLYKDTLKRLRQEDKRKTDGKGKGGMQIYVDAAMQLKIQKKGLNVDKCVGAVPGIEIGDHFQFRAELVCVGLHNKFMAGIDYKNIDGRLCATSIITSGRYGDKTNSSNVLIYVGEGGKPRSGSEKPEDQYLVRGNLALKNSINVVPVRVIRRIQNMKALKSMHADSVNNSNFFYDGLYFVRKCWAIWKSGIQVSVGKNSGTRRTHHVENTKYVKDIQQSIFTWSCDC